MQYQTFEHDDKMVGFKTWLVSYLKDNPIKKGARFNATCAWRLTTLKVNDFVFEDGESRLVDRFQLDIAICPDLAIIDTNKYM
jgi:hypothetical protein